MSAIYKNGKYYLSNSPLPVDEISISSAAASWVSTTVGGVSYYKYTQVLSTCATEHPNISIGASGVLPTAAEKAAYSCVDYATVDKAGLKLYLYAQIKPGADFKIIVEGVEV